ncbi:hypothetical protein QQS21_003387 [Conoideocrella luteorostrata]|uniref:Uncharacterized protein n=1 Tax=Conoideocrella luteorostrata TaxID=1105319 RepID=A0AAJ0G2A9_9HYPO|nr:hypothetical protein QQS21_003387 [Conoideocrella luteorostrata]
MWTEPTSLTSGERDHVGTRVVDRGPLKIAQGRAQAMMRESVAGSMDKGLTADVKRTSNTVMPNFYTAPIGTRVEEDGFNMGLSAVITDDTGIFVQQTMCSPRSYPRNTARR